MNQLQRYEDARDRYEAVGVDTDAAIRKMMEIPVSLHCWQGDDFRTDAYRGKIRGNSGKNVVNAT